jgi:hypothetical protein
MIKQNQFPFGKGNESNSSSGLTLLFGLLTIIILTGVASDKYYKLSS